LCRNPDNKVDKRYIEHNISQFADDTTSILDGTFQSLNESIKTLDNYVSIAGLKINCYKTQAVWISSQIIMGRLLTTD